MKVAPRYSLDDQATAASRRLRDEVERSAALAVEFRRRAELANFQLGLAKHALVEQRARADRLHVEVQRLRALINTPETERFFHGVAFEAAHQVERWSAEHDAGKTPWDWFWLIGYLAQKAAMGAVLGNMPKARHHVISTAAALLNWHRSLSGEPTPVRPGIEPPKGAEASA